MRTATGVLAAALLTAGSAGAADPPPGFPKFQVQEIAADLSIGYAVIVADLNGDKKPDIVVVDKHRVVWYENPTWKVRTILQGKTKPDNVCIAALDIDGDGQLDLVLGAGWKPFDTQTPGTLQWLKRGKTLDDEWTQYPIPCDEPMVHRVRVADLDGDGKPEIVVAPLMGRGATAKGNWMDGRPVRILSYEVPKDPTDPAAWTPDVISHELHVVHNFCPIPLDLAPELPTQGDRLPPPEILPRLSPPKSGKSDLPQILTASYEGVSLRVPGDKKGWHTLQVGAGNQANRSGSRGSSEVKMGHLSPRISYYAAVEPWHGNQIVTYTEPAGRGLRDRHVIDDKLRWGHAVWCADLDGDGADELIVGVRDDPNPKAGDTFTDRRGVRIYKCTDGKGTKWDRHILEDGGVAVEDLAVADLDGDGKPDIVAVGRQTGNVRVYWQIGGTR